MQAQAPLIAALVFALPACAPTNGTEKTTAPAKPPAAGAPPKMIEAPPGSPPSADPLAPESLPNKPPTIPEEMPGTKPPR